MTNESLIVITGAGTTVLTVLLNGLFVARRDKRRRLWYVEDQERALNAQTAHLELVNTQRTNLVLREIKEGTDVAKAAFQEANATNVKIQGIHERIDTVVTETNKALKREE